MASRFWTRIKACLSGQKKNPGHRLFSLLLVAFATGVPALIQGGMAGAVHAVLGILCLCAMAAHAFARRKALRSGKERKSS